MTLKSENKTEYDAWRSMKQRCQNINRNPTYAKIKICQRWDLFENFFSDMGQRPAPGYSIDRIDNSGNYSPDNCRWATLAEQNHNKSNNLRIKINGETKVLAEWSRESGLSHGVIKHRIDAGWPEHRWLEPAMKKERIIHPKEHSSWEHMMWRHPNNICDRWKESFNNFWDDMGPMPGPKYCLSRINENSYYCPENCKWATRSERSIKSHLNRRKFPDIGC